jgi:hypothetical protein
MGDNHIKIIIIEGSFLPNASVLQAEASWKEAFVLIQSTLTPEGKCAQKDEGKVVAAFLALPEVPVKEIEV